MWGKRFHNSVGNVIFDCNAQLKLLLDYTKGKAYTCIENRIFITPPEKALATAFEYLKKNFGRTDIIRRAFVKQITCQYAHNNGIINFVTLR